VREILKLTTLGFRALTRRGKKVLVLYGVGLSFLSLLDAAALGILAKSFLAVSENSETRVTFEAQPLIFVVVLFLVRSILSTAISYVGLREFAKEETILGQAAFHRFINAAWTDVRLWKQSKLIMDVDRAPNGLVQGFLLLVVTILSEVASAFVIFAMLLILQPITAISTIIFFISVAILQHKWLSKASSRAGKAIVDHVNFTYDLLNDAFAVSKILRIMPSNSLENVLKDSRSALSLARAKSNFFAMLPRYFMESILAIGFVVVAAATYYISGSAQVFPAITVFAAAGFRLLPIINRIQGLILALFSAHPLASEALRSQIELGSDLPIDGTRQIQNRLEDNAMLSLSDVCFKFPDSNKNVLQGINLQFQRGKQYAIVGPSGSGKTTLLDLIIGLIEPSSGTVQRNSQVIGYVPQDTHLTSGTISENVALEWNSATIDESNVSRSVTSARLEEIVDRVEADSQLTKIGNVSLNMSGGQKQRIGLARALYRNPTLLALDEATSALDTETEHQVMQTVSHLRGNMTTIIIAHRLSTVQHADQVIYLEDGIVRGIGTFTELRKSVPNFARQVEIGILKE